MRLRAQHVEMRFAGRQANRLVKVLERLSCCIGIEKVQLTAILKGLPQARAQADGVREEPDCRFGLAFVCQTHASIENSRVIRDGGKASAAEDVEISAENGARP